MQNKDFEWFIANINELYAKYGECYLAVKDEKVLGKYTTYAEGVRETEKSNKSGTFIVQKCGPDEEAYTNYISSLFVCV